MPSHTRLPSPVKVQVRSSGHQKNHYQLWAGERRQFEKAVPRCKRVDRPISVSAVPFGPGIDIRRSCKLLGAMLRALGTLPGGLGRFMPWVIGANHCRLRHISWEKSGHGLTSRPRETSSVAFLDELLVLFGLPSQFWVCTVGGTLPLRYCVKRFAHKVPSWRLLAWGGVADLLDQCGGRGAIVSCWFYRFWFWCCWSWVKAFWPRV